VTAVTPLNSRPSGSETSRREASEGSEVARALRRPGLWLTLAYLTLLLLMARGQV
jgi:hypothetical protein